MTIDLPVSLNPVKLLGVDSTDQGVLTDPARIGLMVDNTLNSIVLETTPLQDATTTLQPASGIIHLSQVTGLQSVSCTRIGFEVTSGALTLSLIPNSNGIGVYDSTGIQLAFADTSSLITATGVKLVTLSSAVTINRGSMYYLAVVSTGITTATFRAALPAPLINLGQTAAPYRKQTKPGTLTTTLDPATGTTATPATGQIYLALLT